MSAFFFKKKSLLAYFPGQKNCCYFYLNKRSFIELLNVLIFQKEKKNSK